MTRLVGYINKELGKYDEALTAYGVALGGYTELAKEFPGAEEYGELEAACIAGASGSFTAPESDSLRVKKNTARQLQRSASLLTASQRICCHRKTWPTFTETWLFCAPSRAGCRTLESNFDLALGLRTDAIAKGQNDELSRSKLASLQRNRALLLVQLHKQQEAEQSLLAARDTFAALANASPNIQDYPNELATTWLGLTSCYRQTGRLALAADASEKAIELWQKLQFKFPNTLTYKQDFARAVYELGLVYGEQEQFKNARDQFTKALAILEPLLVDQMAPVQLQQARNHIYLGIALLKLNQTDDARRHYQEGVKLLEAMNPSAVAARDVCEMLATGHFSLAALLTSHNIMPAGGGKRAGSARRR